MKEGGAARPCQLPPQEASGVPRVSIIIPVHGHRGTLDLCLESIFRLRDPNFEVIVVDDASRDGAESVYSKFPVKLLKNDRQMGAGISRNKGADASAGEILAFTDSDCIVDEDWLEKIRGRLAQGHPVVCGPYKSIPWQKPMGRYVTYDWHNFWFRHLPANPDSFSMGNVAFRREAFMERERLEEHFFHRMAAGEDTIVGMTLPPQCRVHYAEDIAVAHISKGRVTDYFRQQMTRGYSRTLLSLLFFGRKVLGSRDINLSFVLPQLLSTVFLMGSVVALPWTGHPWILLSAVGLHIVLQVPSLAYIQEQEHSVPFLVMSLFLALVRNLGWMAGMVRGIFAAPEYLRSRRSFLPRSRCRDV